MRKATAGLMPARQGVVAQREAWVGWVEHANMGQKNQY
jgi:hypothetical protein